MKKFSCLLILICLFLLEFQLVYAQDRNVKTIKIPGDSERYHLKSFGENVFIFDPSMNMEEIQRLIDTIYKYQSAKGSEFNQNRFALLFKPGHYRLDIKAGYYMHIIGLGESPEDVVITGAVRSKSTNNGNHVLTNFWREAENLTVIPTTEPANVWAVSQASALRRVYIKGNLQLHDNGYASGGFLADSKVDGEIMAGSQQQWFTRNSELQKWSGGAWNIMFLGVSGAPADNWPEGAVTTIEKTPSIREKPYWVIVEGKFSLKLPAIKQNSNGPGWLNGNMDKKAVPIDEFYIITAGCSTDSINNALRKGKNLLFTPGIYHIEKSIKISKPGTIVFGIGMPTIVPVNGNSAIEISDVDNVSICGLILDAGKIPSQTLMQVGEPNSGKDHSETPTFLYDVFFRVGGATEGSTASCLTIESKNVIVDHVWIWRADHGKGVGWNKSRCANGLIVNGDDVTVYGLFNEHFQEYQTLWKGEKGKVYFYQSELPYDPPTVDAWEHAGIGGYASYKVDDNVKEHEAWGLGIYCYFPDLPVIVSNAIETPETVENKIHHKMIFWLNGNNQSAILNIINDKGGKVTATDRRAVMN
jgi:hypothetical protein